MYEDFRFKKSLGQNFLIDKNIANKIIICSGITEKDVVLEIGPGDGFLTQFLIEKSRRIISVEIDKKLYDNLLVKFKNNKNIEFLNKDILKLDLFNLKYKPNIIIANIPYNITSEIIFRGLENYDMLEKIVLMMQKEVADRILAREDNKTYGILSVVCQTFWDIEKCMNVPKTVFIPRPKIDSSVVKFTRKKNGFCTTVDKGKFVKLIRIGFNYRRKTLINNLKKVLDIDEIRVTDFLIHNDLNIDVRPENLSVIMWQKLYNLIRDKIKA
jgi:16S rRNA (adenine1518-N6/adenine1519-N6)-dimethyltransferase